MKVHYIANYSADNKWLNSSPAGDAKMKYVISALQEIGCDIVVYSTAEVKGKRFFRGRKERISDKTILKFQTSFNSKIHILKRAQKKLAKIQLLKYLKRVKRDEIVLVYHNLPYMPVIDKIYKKRKFKLVLEVEELYSLVQNNSKERFEREKEFLKRADAYIFSTKKLNDYVNALSLPYCVAHGNYSANARVAEPEKKEISCVYAGTFNRFKGGVMAAIETAEFLPENYHIHIAGFGSDEDIELVKNAVNSAKNKHGACVSYHGLKVGNDFLNLVQRCHIGLSTQNPQAAFNDTSFPSKILSYMANGLRVVSIRIPAVENSDVGQHVYYYDVQDGRNIAKAIMSINMLEEYDSRAILSDLDGEFKRRLKCLLENI